MTPLEEHLARLRGHDLAELSHHWGDAYAFRWESGQFHAKRRDNGAEVHTRTAADMWRAVRADYEALPVPRDIRLAYDI
jgi:hypothetical protein